MIVRTAAQKAIGGYSASLPHSADLEMWMRFAAHGAVARIDAFQAIYRLHSSNMSKRYYDRELPDLQQRKEAFDAFFKDYADRLPGGQRLHERAIRRLAEKAFWGSIIQLCRGRPAAALSSTFAAWAISLCRSSGPARRSWQTRSTAEQTSLIIQSWRVTLVQVHGSASYLL